MKGISKVGNGCLIYQREDKEGTVQYRTDVNVNILDSLNDLWLETMLLCIGECFGSNSEDVCGAVVSPRAKVFSHHSCQAS